MSRALEIDSMNDILSVSMMYNSKFNSYYKANTEQRKDKSTDISLAGWLLHCVKNIIRSNDLLQRTDRVVGRTAYSEAAKYF